MRVLLTGASSFTGAWFAEALAAGGHEVVATLTRQPSEYEGTRAVRVGRLAKVARIEPGCRFGDDRFLALADIPFDVLCHHGAVVTGYRSLDFDVAAALAANTRNIRAVLERLAGRGLRAVVATGSVFECDEGLGEAPLRAFSPYGLAKHATAEVVDYWCGQTAVLFHKFVIANPFGPYEEPRFCQALLSAWRAGRVAEVRTPAYRRDNIHVDLLALAYARFVEDAAAGRAPTRFGPQGYCGTQGEFAARFAAEIGPRLGLDARLSLLPQTDFPEPLTRFNITPIDPAAYGWTEASTWDRLADHYAALLC